MTLKEILVRALKEGWALPHFNISDESTLRGICEAARELRSPLMIGVSEGERKAIGLREAVAMVEAFREEYRLPLFLNADHSKSVESAREALDAGFESVHIDLSKESFEVNLKGTKEIVEYAKSKAAASGKDIQVEGELGYLVTDSSKVYKEVIEIPPESLTKPDEAVRFVFETGVDRFAPAVGNLHGIAANLKKLDIERIRKIREMIGKTALVLHGGSATPEDQIKEAIKAGINNIHINTEIRVAYADSLRRFLETHSEETTPYKMFEPVIEAVKEKTAEKIRLFGSVDRV